VKGIIKELETMELVLAQVGGLGLYHGGLYIIIIVIRTKLEL